MALPLSTPNTTCDIYRSGNAPPAAPDVAAVKCHLTGDWAFAHTNATCSRAIDALLRWTHLLLLAANTDVRDGYAGDDAVISGYDTIYIPDQDGTPFRVVFQQRVNRNTPQDHKQVFLTRMQPTWPTNEV